MMIAMEKKEAETKWCPYIRVIESQSRVYPIISNREDTFDANPHCITDMCMKWEWIDGLKQKGYCGA